MLGSIWAALRTFFLDFTGVVHDFQINIHETNFALLE